MLDKMAKSECFKICHLVWNMKTHVIYISFCGILFFTWQSPGQWGQSLGIFIWGKIKFDLFIKRKPHISEEYNTQAVNITQIILSAHAWVSGPDLAPQKFLLSNSLGTLWDAKNSLKKFFYLA